MNYTLYQQQQIVRLLLLIECNWIHISRNEQYEELFKIMFAVFLSPELYSIFVHNAYRYNEPNNTLQ